MPLTDVECRNAACPEGRPYVRLADAGGLYLEVSRSGAKLWRWKYRFGGKETHCTRRASRNRVREMLSRARRDGKAVTGTALPRQLRAANRTELSGKYFDRFFCCDRLPGNAERFARARREFALQLEQLRRTGRFEI